MRVENYLNIMLNSQIFPELLVLMREASRYALVLTSLKIQKSYDRKLVCKPVLVHSIL